MRRSRITPKAFGLEKLHCNGDEGFGGVALATNSGPGLPTLGDGNVGLVDLDVALQLLASRAHHGSAQPMQDGPGGLIAAQSQHPLQSQGADTLLLVGYIPRRAKPHRQRGACFIEQGPGGDAALMPAHPADEPRTSSATRKPRTAALRTNETIWPAQSRKIANAGFLRGEPVQELTPVSRVVLARNR